MTENPSNLKPQRPKHVLARAIGVILVISTAFSLCRLIGIDTKSFWPFMVLMVGGSFIGNFVGVLIAKKWPANREQSAQSDGPTNDEERGQTDVPEPRNDE